MARSDSPAAQAALDLEQQVRLLLERDARRTAELEALQARLEALMAPAPPPITAIEPDYRRWAGLSAQEKSQLQADAKYPAGPDKRPFAVQLVYQPRRNQTGRVESPPSEWPRLTVHAHSEHEARAFYQDLCTIKSFDQEVTYLDCQPAGA